MITVRSWGGALLVNALDLGSSLCLHGADQQQALPARPSFVWGLQLALLLPLAAWLVRATPTAWRQLRRLPAPAVLQALVLLTLVTQVAHVFLRSEHYPFSAVTMFSDYLPEQPEASPQRVALYLVDGHDGPEPVSFLREGNRWFSSYLELDYKAGWLLGTHAQSSVESSQRVAALLESASGRRARLATVNVDPHDGSLELVESTSGERADR